MDYATVQLKLQSLRVELLTGSKERPIIAGREADPMDEAIALQHTYWIADERTREAIRLRAIEAALLAIRDGSYGTCDCGEAISEKRLDAVPEALLCRDCQQAMEQGGRMEAA